MSAVYERSLAILDADEPNARVELVQIAAPNTQATLELRLQRMCGELGWTTHRRVRIGAGQIGDLRAALQLMDPDAQERRPRSFDHPNVVELRSVAG